LIHLVLPQSGLPAEVPLSGTVWARILEADQTWDGPLFQVNEPKGKANFVADVVSTGDGLVVVVWRRQWTDDGASDVVGRAFGTDGSPFGAEFTVGPGSGPTPRAALLPNGDVLVAWEQNGQEKDVVLARTDPTGAKAWEVQTVNTYTLDDQNAPDITVLPDGSIVVVWVSAGQGGQPATHIFASRFSQDGKRLYL
jgi:hypothetical protein